MMDGRFDQHFLEVFASGERGPGTVGTASVLILVLVAVAVAAALILVPGSGQPLA